MRIRGVDGLVLDIMPSGRAVYRVAYSIGRPGGKRTFRKHKIGVRGVTELHEVRTQAIDIMRAVGRGEDPAADRMSRRSATTFRQLAERRLAEDGDLAPATRDYHRWALTKHVFPAFGDKAADEVTPADVVRLVDRIAKSGALVTADRVRGVVGGIFNWAKGRLEISSNPATGLPRRSTSLPRECVLTDPAIVATWNAIELSDLTEATKIVLRLLLYTGQRSGEVIGARVSELDLDAALWTIPGKVRRKGRAVALNGRTTKSGNEQRVPLPRQAVLLFRRALDLAGDGAEFVFPARRLPDPKTPKQPHLDRHSISRAAARLRQRYEIGEATPHDYRRTLATWLGESECPAANVPTRTAKLRRWSVVMTAP